MFCNMLKATISAFCLYQMDATSVPVAPSGMMGAVLGLGGVKTGVSERVTYMVIDRVSHRWASLPHPMLVQTDAALELRSLWREWMVAYVGSP